MKRILLAAASIAAIASPALADPTTSPLNTSVTVNGTVQARCEFQGAEGLGSYTVTVPEAAFLDMDNGQLRSALQNGVSGALTGVTMWCNGAGTDVALSASPFGNTSADVNNANFADRVDYALSVGLTGVGSLNVNTSSANKGAFASQAFSNVGPFIGSPAVAFDIVDDNRILVAGNYSGTVALTVTPGI